MTAHPLRLLILVIALALVGGACANGGRASSSAPTVTTEHTGTFVVIGAGPTIGDGLRQPLQQAWPRLVFREAMPRTTVFVNAAIEGGTVATAVRDQVSLAQQLHPTVIAVWLGVLEVIDREPIEQFTSEFDGLMSAVVATGARVLVADVPNFVGIQPAPYNAVIRRVVHQWGATLVPLSSRHISASSTTGPLFPDEAGHRAIADAFETALKS
jgi:hypothetical protein